VRKSSTSPVVDRPPEPVLTAADRNHHFIEVPMIACVGFGYDFNKRRLFDLTRVR
jgi:hypothetical protein